ncbi:adhesion G-protein coupled receptor V1-like [Anneissia japonica]|uniref:adhesion G-protein coupled receptor V1-like n=1 Tax=Anneissia japonica TaxID=1529436 RepID=UPI0014259778|nr:adhesion G-protein coupled receptor V1-like [Anneissia japonica]
MGSAFCRLIIGIDLKDTSDPDDLNPTVGSVLFQDGQDNGTLTLRILTDRIPENDETFQIRLLEATGGAKLDEAKSTLTVIILKNDSPLRFSQTFYMFEEDAGTVSVDVHRGLSADGVTQLGSDEGTVVVDYFMVSSSGKLGLDALASNGSLTFSPREYTKTIFITILSDDIPEIGETFNVHLANPSSNAVLAEPSIATVIILGNDDQNGVLSLQDSSRFVTAAEGTGINSDFVVQRVGGTFGNVSIDYEIVRNDSNSNSVTDDLTPASGTVYFMEGQATSAITITINDDSIPEEAERYAVRILPFTVTGGARVSGPTEGQLLLVDSDDAYGVIQFSSDNDQSIDTSESPRKLKLTLTRGGGLIGNILVNFTVTYDLPSEEVSAIGTEDVLDLGPGTSTVFPQDLSIHRISINIRNNAFLSVDAVFTAAIQEVSLHNYDTVFQPSSPRIGEKSVVALELSTAEANGEVGFDQESLKLEVQEPDGDTPAQIRLNVTREGTSGYVSLLWRISEVGVNSSMRIYDLFPTSGTVYMLPGFARGYINIQILSDDVPELEEKYQVDLYSIIPENQRLKEGYVTAEITVLENDAPGGVFEFASFSSGPFVTTEAYQVIRVSIIRTGSSLATRQVMYSMFDSSGESNIVDFFNVPNFITFQPGEIMKNISFVANSDNIPELDEIFDLRLESYGSPPSDLGERTNIMVTILENDDPYGVFQFEQSPTIIYIDESKGTPQVAAYFPVERTQGTFETVTVSWIVSPQMSPIDVYPVNGSLTFLEGESLSYIEIFSQDDQVPEGSEQFTVTLYDATGGSRIGINSIAFLNINKNDDAIFFEDPVLVEAEEPSNVVLSVRRNGTATDVVSVDYRTVSITALDERQDYEAAQGTLTFPIGINVQTISLTILQDDNPEEAEIFTVELFNPVGDVVVYGAPVATVSIVPNDDASGIFSFSQPLSQTAQSEGTTVDFFVQRERGFYGVVQVYWMIVHNGTDDKVINGQEFVNVEGVLEFADRQSQQVLSIQVLADSIPEFTEYYEVKLVNVSGGFPNDKPKLSETGPMSVVIKILPNDDPFGVLRFPSDSRERDVAEDFYPGDEAITKTNFTVVRGQGLFSNVGALWEVFTDSISGGLPEVIDLLFVGEHLSASGVQSVPEQRRPHTGTSVFSFSGGTGSYLSVPAEYQPPPAEISSGFSISAWVKPTSDCNGFIVSKVSAADNIKMYYGLKLEIQSSTSVYIEFRYSTDSSVNLSAGAIFSGLMLTDDQWHQIIAVIGNLQVQFFVDGQLEADLNLSDVNDDGVGLMYVGARLPSSNRYKGLLQDVRLYSRRLTMNEISEIWNNPATKDVTPISGYVTFNSGESVQQIRISSIQDTEEEGNEVFTVNLLTVNGGARLDSDDTTAILTVLKSDNANGLFGFDGPCRLSTSDPLSAESITYTCPVMRSRGDEGVVSIPWEVQNLFTGDATSDFINASGVLVFENGVREMEIIIVAVEDLVPELAEDFTVKLITRHPMSDDGIVGSTDTSGASIDPENLENNLTLALNDFPYGLLQFAVGSPPDAGDPLIPPEEDIVRVSVQEDAGFIQLLVVRAQGLLGPVTVEWSTLDGTAVSAGKDPIDFIGAGGTLTFEDQQRYAYINVTIVDNNIPELEKTFRVQLSNPTGGDADLDIGSTVEVTIENSDEAYGLFEFAENSLDVTVSEMESAAFQVIRTGGALGVSVVFWNVTPDPSSPAASNSTDLLEYEGNVTFSVEERATVIELQPVPDQIPELDEMFYVNLISVSDGDLGESQFLVAKLTITASDDPYGRFVFDQESLQVVQIEANQNITLKIIREAGSVGSVRVFYSSLRDDEELPNMPSFISRASEGIDFQANQGSMIFTDGQREGSVTVTILDDNLPETEETMFIYITRVTLLESPQTAPVTDSPSIGDGSIAEVVIPANDNANGILQLSASEITVSEDFSGPFINITRTAGSFGQISISFETNPDSAQRGLDYSITSTNVVFLEGETTKALPVEILNDPVPEIEEQFEIILLNEITGGAALGSPSRCAVTITPSDDPNGKFGFGQSHLEVNEPEGDDMTELTISVIRSAGDIGVVAVTWQATINGELAVDDVFPTGGTLYFLSTHKFGTFKINILPDDIPEETEDIILTIVSADGGGSIGSQSTAVISISANDNPHGMVEFSNAVNPVAEDLYGNSITNIELIRRGGLFGELEIVYSSEPLDVVQEAYQSGLDPTDYYHAPIQGSQMGISKTVLDVSRASSPLTMCVEFCLRERACAALEFKEINATVSCLWSVTSDGDNIDSGSGFTLYIKDVSKAQLLYDSVAQPGVDYSPVMSRIVRIPDGAGTGTVTVTILDDAIPEMAESFKLRLDSVRLVGSTPSTQNEPTLGPQSETRLVIETNDDANGVWRIYSNSPDATDNGQTLLVEERNGISVGVELTVERMGGTIGDVMVSWQAADGGSADMEDDFIASGGTLSFASGESRRVISISIRDDVIPEVDENVVIELYDPQGGSVLGADSSVTIVIASNDFVAGTLKFATLSYIVAEGETFNVTIERTLPAVGLVSVDWQIQGTGELDPSQSFRNIAGKVSFGQGQLGQVISLYALPDETPEVNEEFVIVLSGVETEGVSSTGAAELDPQGSVASITISASDEPHGVFSFAQGSDEITVSEDQQTVQLFVDRKFGNIGAVRVFYEVLEGSLTLNPLPSLNQALFGQDFSNGIEYIDFGDGVGDMAITVQILQDEIPELDEKFLVNLTSVELLDPSTTNTPPALDQVGTIAEVTIGANDGTQGVVMFAGDSQSVSIEEGVTNVTLTVKRDKGTYGDVTVFIYSQPLDSTRGSDYSFTDKVLYFASGEAQKTVTVHIFEDVTPEDNESFEIILGNPNGGLEIGEPRKAVITILANDNAYGIVSFTGPTTITILEPTDISTANSVAQFAVVREQGTFGEIQVPFQVLQMDGQSAVSDLNPATGFVIFTPGISTTVLHVSAVLDNDPELQEQFLVKLLPPTGGAILGTTVNATIIVADNDSPYGLLQIFPQGSSSSSVDIEETGQPTYLTVERSFGTLNEITVDWQTIPGTAIASVGTSLTLAASQRIIAMAAQGFHSFAIGSEVFLVLTSSRRLGELTTGLSSDGSSGSVNATPVMDSMMYRWQGVFVPVQTIETNSARKSSSHVINGKTYLVVANHGWFRNVQTSSRLYRVESNGTLVVIQDILTMGASDAVFFTSGSDTYLFITNEINNIQETSINSVLLIWNGAMFTTQQEVPTSGALDAVTFKIGGDQFVAVANSYDQVLGTTQIKSTVFQLQSGELVEYQSIDTNGAVAVESFVIGSSSYLVIANSRSSDESVEVTSVIYKWNIANAQFAHHQSIPTPGVQSIKHYTGLDGTAHLVVAQLEGDSTVWAWNSFALSFTNVAKAPVSHDLEPILISSTAGAVDLYIASANYGDGSTALESFIYEAVSISADSDFVPRSGQLTFEDGQTELTIAVVATDDTDPENDERFSVALSNPTGGAIIGSQGQVTVNILSNDDAHGLIAFTQDSLEKQVSELNVDNVVVLNVERQHGSAGLVVIEWQASGDNDANDISPQSGQIEFRDGVSSAAIVITIKADSTPELDETVFISLVRVVNPGTPHSDRGAVISSTDYTARMIILANDSPHGVFAWSLGSLFTSVPEPEGHTSVTIGLQVIREQGVQGTVLVRYSTFEAIGLPLAQQAKSDRDYVSREGYVTMGDGVSSDSVTITILSDTDAEGPETFFVNLTSVELLTGSPISGAPPSVKKDQNVAEVIIPQNDNANGILQFSVMRNSANQVEVYEGSGTSGILTLPVVRSAGTFNIVGVSWLAFSASATTADYSPVSGNITFAEGQQEAVIDISIIDDNVYETDELFTVQLNSPRGGAVLGSDTFVTIKILKNDSPKGLFGFTNTQATVAESTTSTDANGLITITVERTQGQQGIVDVVWELDASGFDDITPSSGTLTFPDGVTSQSFTLRAVADNVLEGEERFMVIITSVTDDAEISPVNGILTIIVQANPGSAGLVSIQPQSRQVLIGEPQSVYDGSAIVSLTRGNGIFGEIMVNWQLDPRDASVFAQTFGSVVFSDGQRDATIVLQTLDDQTPELKRVFTLRLSSVVGGATIDAGNADEASITVVASDNPHGVFEFSGQQEVVVSEDSLQVTLEVVRNAGSIGIARVIYTTIPGTASEIQDFNPASGFLTFNDGVDTQSIVINLQPDDVPEGPETFHVNLTSVQLLSPSGNDYSIQDGLQLDMPPVLGDLSVKTVIIEKNDNAEGVIEFAPEALVFVVQESVGTAMVPVIRTQGTFGIVSVGFTSVGGSATPNGVDYILTDGEAIFLDGESTAYINVNIIDDQIKEFAESFEIRLTQAEGGATLGQYLTATVTIAKSDGPDGLIGFVPSDLSRIIPNPSLNREVVFTVELSGGIDQYLTGTEVKWRILGPNSDSVLQQTNDISTSTGQLQGSLNFARGERAARSFTLVVKPYPGPEVEETYTVEVYQLVGAGEVNTESSRAQLKILKFGDPNGIVQFYADSLQTRSFSEPADSAGSSRVVFPIRRRDGTIGDILVHWDVRNTVGDISTDVSPSNGSVEILDGIASSQITINILADQEPELREELNVILQSVDGGAEIDPDFNVSTFFIDPSDDPHGLFSVEDELQAVSMRADGTRFLSIMITRSAGTEGQVQVDFTLSYDQAEPGIEYIRDTATVVCANSQSECTAEIQLVSNNVFLARDSSFTITLTSVIYSGVPYIPPRIKPGAGSATIFVTQEVANSYVGFDPTATDVNEETYQTLLTIERIGSYGSMSVSWTAGYPPGQLPPGFTPGSIIPSNGQVLFDDGQALETISIRLNPSTSTTELFAVFLNMIDTSVDGGARLQDNYITAEIDKYGVVGFAADSQSVSVTEVNGQISLTLERSLGTFDNILVRYVTYALTAVPGEDYQEIVDGAVTLGNMERTAKIFITLLEEEKPELPEMFFVNITSTKISTASTSGLSPRISSLYPVAEVTIEASNDPYGVIYLRPKSVETTESIDGSFKLVTLKAIRAGGTFTEERITVRTVGGGEMWEDALIGPPADTINTISDALADAKLNANSATKDLDYEEFEEELIFFEGETEVTFQVKLFDDTEAEPAEVFFVYLVPPSTGARIAQGESDNGEQGFTRITIAGSDDHNGEIGFDTGSMYTTVDEDVAPSIVLYLNRGSAFFDNVTVNWQAARSMDTSTNDDSLVDQLVATEGQIICIAGQPQCELQITLQDDTEPEFSSSFLVELLSVGQGAVIQESARYANITMLESDYPYGIFRFSTETRIQSAYYKSNLIGLTVLRGGGSTKEVTIGWSTRQLTDSLEWGGVNTQPAIEYADYAPDEGVIPFAVGQRSASIDITILSSTPTSSDLWPKLFQVVLSNPTGGASVDEEERTAYITLVEDESTNDVWDTWKQALTDLSDEGIYRILQSVRNQIQDELTDEQLAVTTETLNNVIGEGQRRLLPGNLQEDMMDVYCELMDPDRSDTRGAYGLAESFTSFTYTLLTDASCETIDPMVLNTCPLAYVEAARWLPDRINGHSFNGRGKNVFSLPSNLLIEDNSVGRGDVPTSQCEDIHFIEYSSQQWFYGLTEPDVYKRQVLSVAIRGREDDFSNLVEQVKYRVYTQDARVTPLGAECVIFNGPSERWLSTFCEANKIETGYVECQCNHLSEFAVLAETDDLVGYNIYIYVSCFITIICLLMALLAHHVCSVHTMFAAKLLMHLIFSVMATEIVFMISAYISNDVSSESCAALGAILHYFFLAQFIWMLVQSTNLWKILVLNDEHTDRFYVLFFVLGWGTPAVIVVAYIIITYSVFEWPFHQESLLINLTNPEVVYGDVHGNGDICFMPNVNAMLASAVGPVVICIMAVVTVFIQAYLVKPQWKRYDDLYMGSYNTTEIRLLLIFWTLLIFTWLFGGLHMYYSKQWMLILLVLFNVIMGLFVFLIYTVLRNQLCRPSKGNYSPNYVYDNSVTLLENHQFDRTATALSMDKESRTSLSKADQARLAMLAHEDVRPSSSISQISHPSQKLEWDVQSVGHQSHHSVRSHQSQRSKRPSIQNGNLYAPTPFNQNPVPPVEVNPTPSFHQNPVFPLQVDDRDETDSQDFDDLIFALKTGGTYSPNIDDGLSEHRSTSRLSDWRNVSRDSVPNSKPNDPDDPYGLQRISIADTHL